MESKEPVLLVVLVDVSRLRWFVAAMTGGAPTPLVCSHDGDLAEYVGLDFDEQVSFLRHRLCGVLQRGVDRLWPRKQKAAQVAIVFNRSLDVPCGTAELTLRVAEHFAEWMTSPPVAVAIDDSAMAAGSNRQLRMLAGELGTDWQQSLDAGLPSLMQMASNKTLWELAPHKGVREVKSDT